MGARTLKKELKLPIHPSFLLFFLWFLFTKNLYSFLIFCLVILTHELGHYFVAKKCGYKLDSFLLAPYGVSLNYRESTFEQRDEILIAFAGPAVNFVLSTLAVSFWWIIPESYNFTYDFVYQSLLLGLFNLLPCYPLDGGRVMAGILSKNLPRKKAINITIVNNVIVSCLLFILFFISLFVNFNASFCFCGVFLVLGIIDSKKESRYQPIAIYKKKTKNFSKPFFYYLSEDVTIGAALRHIEINRFTIFVIRLNNGKVKMLDEEKIKLLSLKFPIETKFKDIL